ncbi:MAG: hypothetical protein WEB58_12880 [Planctomycetaceae bacterium]
MILTPHQLRLKILEARQDSLRRLRSDFNLFPWLTPPSELLAVLKEEREAIQREILAIQRERERNSAYCGVPVEKTTA